MIQRDNLLKQIGFYQTLKILDEKGRGIKLRAFYEKLYENGSYYNAVNRVKDTMISKEIIKIYYGNIKLTRKGITIKQTLTALLELME